MPSRLLRAAIMGLSFASAASAGYVSAADASPAQSLHYQTIAGDSVQAILLKAPQQATVLRDQVILFDTSASQTGMHRTQALLVLDRFLEALPTETRVRLFAIDVETAELTSGFAPAGSADVKKARALLARRAPLGATDLKVGLQDALKAAGDGAASVVYLGDGMSASHLLQNEELKGLLGKYRSRQIPVSSYAVGPRRDLQLLGIVAHWTGGAVLLDGEELNAVSAARELATAVQQNVVYLDSLNVESVGTTLLPGDALPLRADRATVVLTRGAVPTALHGTTAEGTLDWSIDATSPSSDNAFLATLAQRAERNSIDMPFAGRDLLDVARSDFNVRVNQLVALGDSALLDRDLRRAGRIGEAIQQLDPSNADARRYQKASAEIRQISLLQDPDDPTSPTADATTRQQPESLLNEMEALEAIIGQRLQLQVSQAIQIARKVAEEDPEAALGILKQAKGAVKAAEDVSPDLRINLARRLTGVEADVKGQKEVKELKEIRAQEAVAAIEAQRRLIDQIAIEDDRMERLIDRVRSLLQDAAQGNPASYEEAEAVAQEAINMRPGDGTATAARVGAEAAGQLFTAYYLRNLRADRFLATLEQVERSHVPFPDEPPIRWPAPEVWKALTEQRRKYASVDLHQASVSEERILAALDDQSSVNFTDTPLEDAILYLQRSHEIPIIIQTLDLEEAGVLVDEPINLNLAGVKLRSVLKLMLEPLQLTYVIEDEVMKITTIDIANEKLSTRVYPVGDLVITLSGQSLGGGIGGALGGGGLGGGQQGGGFGGGGLGGGGFGGGGGGGAFMIAPKAVPPKGMSKMQQNEAAPKPKQIADPELQGLLDGVLNKNAAPQNPAPQNAGNEAAAVKATSFAGIAQVPNAPFRFDNKSISELKKKR